MVVNLEANMFYVYWQALIFLNSYLGMHNNNQTKYMGGDYDACATHLKIRWCIYVSI